MTLVPPSPRRVGPVTRTDIVRFAGAGGDFNPLHHDPEAARRAGFDDVIAMGQFQAGILAGFLTDWVGVENLRSLDVRFVAPVRLGDTIEVSATVGAVRAGLAEITLVAAVNTVAVVSAEASVAVAVSVAADEA
ncbi:MaoC family dehydratase [Subtercola endophyticus]|uniref:MaoC family dehydratase n=1 Tax=Subtercola endophyticus TaxID=2895559 RepID=UPI001E51BEEF|nr:MaoC/PaaZ C-terminal domain-containing protein [Subtercola endophyticus]UFS58136.1 MaoC family dehydratase N-terminal domain-containing protein [Subtercola endophyticus]